MTYVMSDIHGEHDRFKAMLQEIQFSDKDTLYILGDMIDYGPDSIAVVQDVMSRKNIQAIMGNHEQMCVSFFSRGVDCQWAGHEGTPTKEAFLALSEKERSRILQYLESLPNHLDIRVGWRRFHLVHGWPSWDHYTRIWGRPEMNSKSPFLFRRVIVGHTPVFVLNKKNLLCVASGIGHFFIEKTNGFIDIDCGCGYPFAQGRLACLRLDDMKEFYV